MFLSSCSDPNGPETPEIELDREIPTESIDPQIFRREVITYFKKIALEIENISAPKVTRKWNQDIMIYVNKEVYKPLLNELEWVILELNELIAKDNVKLILTTERIKANCFFTFGTNTAYNYGYFNFDWNEENYFYTASIFIDTQHPKYKNQLHLIREELTQSLGLAQDSYRFSDSIFQQNYNTDVTEFSNHDKVLIKLLYHPKMKTGLDETTVDPILDEIVDEVIAEVLEP